MSEEWRRYRSSLGASGESAGSAGDELQESWFTAVLSPAASGGDAALRRGQGGGAELFRVDSDSAAGAAAEHFHKNGFVVLEGALEGAPLAAARRTSVDLMRTCAEVLPGGSRGSRRWTLQRTTMIGGCLELVDNEAVCRVLERFWDSGNFLALCTGGDFSLPGAEAQELHSDVGSRHAVARYFAYHDPLHPDRHYCDLPTPVVKVYFTLVDHDRAAGPTLFVPGTHRQYPHRDVPGRGEGDPPGSVLALCPGGSAVLMDMRVFHRGTANSSSRARPMLAVHYAAPWYSERVLRTSTKFWEFHRGALSLERWKALRLRQQQLCVNLLPRRCMECDRSSEDGRFGTGGAAGFWYCAACWDAWRGSETLDSTEHSGPPIQVPASSKILGAWYGSAEAGQWADVTATVARLHRDRLHVRACNDLFCDPAPGFVKKLVVNVSGDAAKVARVQ